MKKPAIRRAFFESERGDVFGLQALLALDHGELDLLPFVQGTVSFAPNGAVMDEHIGAALALNESVALGVIEPLDGAYFTISHLYHISN
jgi:hypothetical protein